MTLKPLFFSPALTPAFALAGSNPGIVPAAQMHAANPAWGGTGIAHQTLPRPTAARGSMSLFSSIEGSDPVSPAPLDGRGVSGPVEPSDGLLTSAWALLKRERDDADFPILYGVITTSGGLAAFGLTLVVGWALHKTWSSPVGHSFFDYLFTGVLGFLTASVTTMGGLLFFLGVTSLLKPFMKAK
jgi:hypothetical protein